MALKRGWAQLCRMCLDTSKMIERRQWSCMTPLRQFKKIPLDGIKRIERKELSLERFFDLSPEELGEHVGVARYGKTLHRYIHQLPKLELSAQVLTVSRSLVKMGRKSSWCKYATEEHTLSFTVPLFEPLAPNYFVSIISNSWLCSETRLAISFRNLLLPSKFPPPTELLDLQPLPVLTLSPHDAMFKDITYFNPIQTQVYHSVYMTDENTLVCAPPGSGKTIIIEWTILRALYHSPQRRQDQRIVYMAPYPSIAQIRYEQWQARFKDWSVVLLTGQTTRDLQLLEKADIVVTTSTCVSSLDVYHG
ncbi:hypothetical protein HMI54_005301 [Coelomomyces lativittatus]|nr:hypothetical protein HMI54_005301 [Coelomomyces lativittatus]